MKPRPKGPCRSEECRRRAVSDGFCRECLKALRRFYAAYRSLDRPLPPSEPRVRRLLIETE